MNGPRSGRGSPLDGAESVAAGLPVPRIVVATVTDALEGAASVPPVVVESLAGTPEGAARVFATAAATRPDITEVSSLGQAAAAAGAAAVRAAIAGASTYSVFDATPGPGGMSPLAFSLRSAHVSRLARSVATAIAPDDAASADAAGTAGLLHDIGLAVVMAVPDRSDDPIGEALHEARLGDHPVIGAHVAAAWRLNASVVRAVRRHEDPRPTENPVECAVWLAARIADVQQGTGDVDALRLAARACGIASSDLALIAMGGQPARGAAGDPLHVLTAREAEVLSLLAEGLVPKQIGMRLETSTSTVHNHLHRVYRKLGVSNQAQALLEARNRGWV